MQVAIRADGYSDIGMGHIMRCQAIADALRERDCKTAFLVSADTESSVIQQLGYPVVQLTESGSVGWSALETRDWIVAHEMDALIVDTYRIDAKAMQVLNGATECFYVDDLHSFDYPIKNIINHNLCAREDFYSSSDFFHKLYLGPKYFPVRKDIVDNSNVEIRNAIRKVLVTTGGTDCYDIELSIAKMLAEDFPDLEVILLIGSFYDASYVDEIKGFSILKHIEVLEWTKEMGKILSSCDLVICPGSTTSLEAFTVGVPVILFSHAENQIEECLEMAGRGFAPYCGDFRENPRLSLEQIKENLGRMLDIETRKSYVKSFSKTFDGKGANRIADIIMNSVGI